MTVAAPTLPPRLTARGSVAILVAYAWVAGMNVLATATGAVAYETVTKALLMPLLLLWLLGATMRPLPRPTIAMAAGVVFAWLGDLALLGTSDLWFIAGMALFLVMQVCYITAFRRVPGPGLVRAWPIALVPYAVAWLALAAAMLLHSGLEALPGLVYGLALVAMAASALDLVIRVRPQSLGWRVAIGAAVFVVSDALIALSAFAGVPSSPLLSATVMATYVVAQAMIVTGFTRAVNARAQAG